MKVATLVVLGAMCLSAVAANELPQGFENANEVAQVLANEPEAAKESRFASATAGQDSITFKDTGSVGSVDDGDAEFDSQIAQVEADMKKLQENIKESTECARRLQEQQAEMRSLEEQKQHLQKEKEKRGLQVKLEKQMKDLSEINRMSRSLRQKFAELKRTQKIIKTKMTGTRTVLQQLDQEEDVTPQDLADHSNQLAGEVAGMQSTQQKVLANGHSKTLKDLKSSLAAARSTHQENLKNPLGA